MKRSIHTSLVLVFLCVFSSNSWSQPWAITYDCNAIALAAYDGATTYGETRSETAALEKATRTYDQNSPGRSIHPEDLKNVLKPALTNMSTSTEISALFLGMSAYGQCKTPAVKVPSTPQRAQYEEVLCMMAVYKIAYAVVEAGYNGRQSAIDKFGKDLPDLRENLADMRYDLEDFARKYGYTTSPFTLFIINRATGCIQKRLMGG